MRDAENLDNQDNIGESQLFDLDDDLLLHSMHSNSGNKMHDELMDLFHATNDSPSTDVLNLNNLTTASNNNQIVDKNYINRSAESCSSSGTIENFKGIIIDFLWY